MIVKGKGNEHPDYRSGDLVVIISVKPDKVFTRKKNDLYINKSISLIESLKGFSFNLKHLNDNDITI